MKLRELIAALDSDLKWRAVRHPDADCSAISILEGESSEFAEGHITTYCDQGQRADLIIYLRNHAKEFADLVEAAETLHKSIPLGLLAPVKSVIPLGDDVLVDNGTVTFPRFQEAIEKHRAALAALGDG